MTFVGFWYIINKTELNRNLWNAQTLQVNLVSMETPLEELTWVWCSGCLHVQVWELSSGELLLSVLFDVEIMSVTFDPCEYFLFCGGSDGNIFQVSLCSQVSVSHQNNDSVIHHVFIGGLELLSFNTCWWDRWVLLCSDNKTWELKEIFSWL